MFDYKKLFYTVFSLIFLVIPYTIASNELLHSKNKKNKSFFEEKIGRQAVRLKKEVKALKSVFFVFCLVFFLGKGYDIVQSVRSFVAPESKSISQSIVSWLFGGLFRFCWSTLVSFVIQKGIGYGISYYFKDHPIFWFLSKRVHIHDHFDSLLYKIGNEHKKSPLCRSARFDVKNYILLFTKIVFKDAQKICAFMRYRASLLPAYKQPTALLIEQNVLVFVLEWIDCIETFIEHESSSFEDLYEETLRFKKLFFEQIDLFVKIDDEKEFLRDIATTTQASLQ